MQPELPLPPSPNPPAEPSMLKERVALTGLFNPALTWREKEILGTIDEKEAARAAAETTAPSDEQL